MFEAYSHEIAEKAERQRAGGEHCGSKLYVG
jgi:hypothetical protein